MPEDWKVSPVPCTISIARKPEDEFFLVVACDGIWDVLSDEVSPFFDTSICRRCHQWLRHQVYAGQTKAAVRSVAQFL